MGRPADSGEVCGERMGDWIAHAERYDQEGGGEEMHTGGDGGGEEARVQEECRSVDAEGQRSYAGRREL